MYYSFFEISLRALGVKIQGRDTTRERKSGKGQPTASKKSFDLNKIWYVAKLDQGQLDHVRHVSL